MNRINVIGCFGVISYNHLLIKTICYIMEGKKKSEVLCFYHNKEFPRFIHIV